MPQRDAGCPDLPPFLDLLNFLDLLDLPMLPRLLLLLLTLSLIGSAALELRRQRHEQLHAIAELHLDMDRVRKATWDTQYRIVELTSPPRLLAALDRLDIPTRPVPTTAAAGNSHEPEAQGHRPWAPRTRP
jgi:hypothetical protein